MILPAAFAVRDAVALAVQIVHLAALRPPASIRFQRANGQQNTGMGIAVILVMVSILDILGIAAVFLAVLYIGYRATKKTKTTEDFLMAGHSLGKIQAGFSMAATDIGGNAVVGAVAYAYACGLGSAWYNWGAVVPMFLLALFLARQLRSISVSSVPELLGRRYNGAVRFISVIAQLLAIGATLGIQFTVAASAVSTISGIALGGLFAAAMSTADSKIMAASQLFINDIYMPHFRKGEGMNDKHVLTISRVVTLGICVMGIGVSLVSESIVQIMYVGGLFYGTAVFVPMILGIYWKRGTASAALAAMISAAAVGLCSEYFLAGQAGGLLGMPSNLLATIVSVAVFLSVSLVTPPPSAQQLEIIAESAQSN